MSRQNKFARGSGDYRRGKPRFPSSGKSFLIVTEGEKTEPNYFKALRDLLQLSATDVEILHPPGTDPLTLVQKAIELKDIRKSDSKKGLKIPYDEVWIVYDLEKPHDQRRDIAQRAIEIGKPKGIKFGESDPCFEFWLLLHEEFTTAPFEDCHAVIVRLRTYWPNYLKGEIPSEKFIRKLPDAIERAQRCRKHHHDSNGDGNPGTKVDILTSILNQATRPHLRLIK